MFVRQKGRLSWRNVEKAKASGNVLTQSIDEEGNLNGVPENVDFESREVNTAESTKLADELAITDDNKKEE